MNLIEKLVLKVKKIMPLAIKSHQDKIKAKFNAALIDVDQDRLKQEFLFFVQKGDVGGRIRQIGGAYFRTEKIIK